MSEENIPKRIKIIRETLKLKQNQLADALYISHSYYSTIENGKADNISMNLISNIARLARVRLNWVAGENVLALPTSPSVEVIADPSSDALAKYLSLVAFNAHLLQCPTLLSHFANLGYKFSDESLMKIADLIYNYKGTVGESLIVNEQEFLFIKQYKASDLASLGINNAEYCVVPVHRLLLNHEKTWKDYVAIYWDLDFMSPTIMPGNITYFEKVDPTAPQVYYGVCAINYCGKMLIRRIQQTKNTEILLSCDNNLYATQTIDIIKEPVEIVCRLAGVLNIY